MLRPRKWSILTVLLLFLMLSHSVAWAVNKNYKPNQGSPETVQQAKEDDNYFLGFSFFVDQLPNGDKLKMIKHSDGGHILVYGNPCGDKKNNEHRFLGKNKFSENISNINFPKLEVMINTDKNRPPEETNWGDNSDSKTVKVQDDPGKKNSGDIFLELAAPAQVKPAKPWTYQVQVNYHWTQTYSPVLVAPAKDEKPAIYRDEPDDPPVVGLSLDVSGEGKHADKYDPNLGVNYTSPVAQKDRKNFSLTGGTGQTYTFTFPGTALMNEGYYVLLKAKLSSGATDSARVYVQPYAVDGLKTMLKPSD